MTFYFPLFTFASKFISEFLKFDRWEKEIENQKKESVGEDLMVKPEIKKPTVSKNLRANKRKKRKWG